MKAPSPLLAGVLALLTAGAGVALLVAFNLVGGRLTFAGMALCLVVAAGLLGLWLKGRTGRDPAGRRIDATVAAMVYVASEADGLSTAAVARIDEAARSRFGAPVSAATRQAMAARHGELLTWLKAVAPSLDIGSKRDLVQACMEAAGEAPTEAAAQRLAAVQAAMSFMPDPLVRPAG